MPRPWRSDLRLLLLSLPIPFLLMVGLYLGSGTITLGAAGLSIAVGLVRPDVGLMSLLIVAPLLNKPVLPAPGYQFFLVGAIILGTVYRLPLDRPRLTVTPLFLLLTGYVIYVFMQQLPEMLAGYPGEELREIGSMLAKLMTALGLVVATALVIRGRSPYPYLAALLISASVAGVLGIVTFISAETAAWLGSLLAEGELGARASGVFSNPNYFGQFMGAGLILSLGWFVGWGRGGVRVVLVVVIGLLGSALLVSQSRGAMVSLAAGLVAAAFARGRKTGVLALVVAGLLAAIVIPLVLDVRVSSQAGFDASGAWERQASSDAFRLNALGLGPSLFASSPIFGIGLFRYTLETGIYPHNWFLRIVIEQGLVGVATIVLGLVFAVQRFARLATLPRSISFGLLGLIVTGAFFHEPQSNIQSFLLLVSVLTMVISADWSVGRTPDEAASVRPVSRGHGSRPAVPRNPSRRAASP